MSLRRYFLLALIPVALAAAAVAVVMTRRPAPEEKPAVAVGSPADLEAIAGLRAAYEKAYGDSDVDHVLALFTDDGVVVPPDEGAYEGKEEVDSYFGDLFDDTPGTIDLEAVETRVTGDWAYERLDATLEVTHSDTGEEEEIWATYLWILQRQKDGSWKIARLMFNYDESGDEDDSTEPHPQT